MLKSAHLREESYELWCLWENGDIVVLDLRRDGGGRFFSCCSIVRPYAFTGSAAAEIVRGRVAGHGCGVCCMAVGSMDKPKVVCSTTLLW